MKSSAAKRTRQAKVARLRNRETKSTFRTAIKKFDAAYAAADKATAESEMKLAAKLLDSAASKGIIHKNTAARLKSRMAAKFNKLAK